MGQGKLCCTSDQGVKGEKKIFFKTKHLILQLIHFLLVYFLNKTVASEISLIAAVM